MLSVAQKKPLRRNQIEGTDTYQSRRKLCKRSFKYFCKQAWHVLESTTKLEWNWHFDALCDHVQAVLEDWMAVMTAKQAGLPIPPQRIQNLAINIPPGTGKSRFVSVFAPAWMWLRWPSWRAIFVSGNPRVALRDADYCRLLIESDWYLKLFQPDWDLARDQNAKSLYRNTAGGFRMAISVGSRVTGDRADALFIDDPNDADEVASDAYRDAVNVWYDQSAGNRVNDLRYSVRILIMQRLHEMDLTGHILKSPGWVHLIIPQEFRPDAATTTPIGWHDPRQTEGERLFPIRFTEAVLDSERARLGPTGYAGQHQQMPAPAGGSRLKSSYFRYWTDEGNFYKLIGGGDEKIVNKADMWLFAVMDPSGTDKNQNAKACYSVIQVWAVTPDADMLLIHEYREQVETPKLANDAVDICRRYETGFLAVEKNGLGLGVIQNIALTGINVVPIVASTSKEARSEIAEIRLAAGKVYFWQDMPNLHDFETELTQFPNGVYCDRVDALSHASAAVQQHHGTPMAVTQGGTAAPSTAGRYKRAIQ